MPGITKFIKFLIVLLLVCMLYQVYSIGLDMLFYKLDGKLNNAVIGRGYSVYFPLFLGFFGIILLIVCIIFELVVEFVLPIKNFTWQAIIALSLGLLVGWLVGNGNMSMYKGQYEDLKSLVLFAALGFSYIVLKWIFRMRQLFVWDRKQLSNSSI